MSKITAVLVVTEGYIINRPIVPSSSDKPDGYSRYQRYLAVGLPQSGPIGAHEPHGAKTRELALRIKQAEVKSETDARVSKSQQLFLAELGKPYDIFLGSL